MNPNPIVPFVDLTFQNASVREEVFRHLSLVVDSSDFVLGSAVKGFEESFAQYCGTRHAVGVGSGTEALTLALKAIGIQPNDEIIAPTNTFVATIEAIVHAGAKPILADVDPLTYNLNPTELEQLITPHTRAIIPVHIYGQSADMRSIIAIARRNKLAVIEDAAQSHGALYENSRVGSLGDIACFSFYPAKNLGAWGDGGAVLTNDLGIASRLRELRDHGSPQKYEHTQVGYTSRLDSVQASVLSVKLKHLDEWNHLRQVIAERYNTLLGNLPEIICPTTTQEIGSHVYHLYVIRIIKHNRDKLRHYLNEQGIQTGIHYPIPIHRTPAFAYLGYGQQAFPVAEQYANEILSLPIYPGLQLSNVDYVAEKITDFLRINTNNLESVAK